MLGLLKALPEERYGPRTYVCAATDHTSEPRAKSVNAVPADAAFLPIPRSREVGQSYVTAAWSTLLAFVACLRLVAAVSPDLLLVNGPGTCLPVCLAAALLRALRVIRPCRIVFVESVCRVCGLSLTGKLLYHGRVADRVMVQWPSLVDAYPRAQFVGTLL
jgi:beta-1,4-N-acetylglucosaminyltransferase